MIYTSNIVPVVIIATRYRKESKILGWVFLMIRVQFCSGSEYLKKLGSGSSSMELKRYSMVDIRDRLNVIVRTS